MSRSLDPLSVLRAYDRRRLLGTGSGQLIGLIMRLNRMPRYHNRLDALQLAALIIDLRSRGERHL